MTDEYPTCVNCGGRIQRINFALGPEWRHWPTPHGNYRTNELYRYCQSAALVATPKSDDPSPVMCTHEGGEWPDLSTCADCGKTLRSGDPSPSGPASQLERGINAPTRDHNEQEQR